MMTVCCLQKFFMKKRASDLPDTQEAAQIYEELGKYFKHEQKALQ